MVDDWPKVGDEVWFIDPDSQNIHRPIISIRVLAEPNRYGLVKIGTEETNWLEPLKIMHPTRDACIAAEIDRLLNQADDRAAVLKEVRGDS